MFATKLSRRNKQTLKAASFGFSLLLITLSALIISFSSIDRVVLGTELNGDGTVEYLCLGSACDNLTKIDW
jgi:hypothetical protein